MYEEKYHFTLKRAIYTLAAFSILFVNSYFDKILIGYQKYTLNGGFVVSMLLLTVYSVYDLDKITHIK